MINITVSADNPREAIVAILREHERVVRLIKGGPGATCGLSEMEFEDVADDALASIDFRVGLSLAPAQSDNDLSF